MARALASGEPVAAIQEAEQPRSALAVPLIAVVAAAIAYVAVSPGQHWPRPWCGGVIGALTAHGGTEAQFENRLGQLQQSGAPVGRLLSDVAAYQYDNASVQAASNFDVLNALATASAALRQVGRDETTIARDCGQPASAVQHYNI